MMQPDPITFAFIPAYGGDEREAFLLAHNLSDVLRGYDSSRSRILILHPIYETLSENFTAALAGLPVKLLPFDVTESFRAFPFAPKVFAAAQAERHTESDLLVWLDSDTLILQPPDAFFLPPKKTAAVCPVHLKNISSLADQPLDDFWRQVYSHLPAARIFNVTTRADKLSVRAHFNAGCLVVRPKAQILATWKDRFEQTAWTDAFRSYYGKEPLYSIFIHQALLSAVLIEVLTENDILLLPENYNYPVFLQSRFNLAPPVPIVTLRYDRFLFFGDQNWKQILLSLEKWTHNPGQL
jgi:hypothetical protein